MLLQRPLYEEIYSKLRENILSGKLVPGTLLPSEITLAQQYEVSRITTTRALKMLTDDGLVIRIRGKGTFVTNTVPNPDSNSEVILSSSKHPILIGYIFPNIRDTYGVNLFSTLENEVSRRGGLLITKRTYGNPALEQEAIQQLTILGVKGLIIYPVNGEYYNPEILRISLEGFPITLVDRFLPRIPIPYFTTDNRQAAYLLTQHLIASGHKKIAFLSYTVAGTVTLEERYAGYQTALREAGLDVAPELCPEIFSDDRLASQDHKYMESCIHLTVEFLKQHRDVTGIVAAEYNFSMYAYAASTVLQRKVPDDLSIVTFDGPSTGAMPWQFTHIRQDEKKIGALAIQSLWKQIYGESSSSIASQMVHGELVLGNSSCRS